MNEIEQALHRIFTRHRIVLWYDHRRELKPEFEAVTLPEVEKIVLDNNAFGVKYRILRDAPKQKFLLYHEGPPPDDLDNWLLDVQLAYGTFRADRVSLWLSEVGLGLEFADMVAPHADFFQAARRRESLKAHLKPDDTPRQVRMAMLAVCAHAEPRLDDVLRHLLAELAEGRDEVVRLIERCALSDFLWEELARAYDYASETPGLRDFTITLFQSCYALEIGAPDLPVPQLNKDALVFLKQWKDSVQYQAAFKALSADCAVALNIEGDLQTREVASVLTIETFELVDRKILSDLVRDVAQRTVAGAEVARWVRRRRQSCWYADYEAEYAALEAAAAFMDVLEQADLKARTAARTVAGTVEQYTGIWFQLDQYYRKFIIHLRQSGQTTLFDALAQKVENLYTNTYVLQVNTQWQAVLDGMGHWESGTVLAQADIFERRVRPFRARDNKIFVVISDGMRYEIGEELLRLVRQEDRYDAELEPALTLLPSYTQLGMAALLPHTRLEIAGDGDAVLVDGQSSAGTENRKKILAQANVGRATALRAEELLAMTRDESRALFRDHDVVYVYHNR
ncbi:MAG: BREX-1 system phosphatase PglZ type A, partial [Anaerolineae bacterium]|nr:BREX-1 system phosphatase PglZ type A [Anaerolineae bacterium]